jgi:hypothetical protein
LAPPKRGLEEIQSARGYGSQARRSSALTLGWGKDMMKRLLIAAMVLAALSSPVVASEPPNPAMLMGQGVQTTLDEFFSDPTHKDYLLFQSMFTTGTVYRVKGKDVTVMSSAEHVPRSGAYVRIGKVAVCDTFGLPGVARVVVQIDTWQVNILSGLVPRHTFLICEMFLSDGALCVDGKLRVAEEETYAPRKERESQQSSGGDVLKAAPQK